MLLPRAAGFLVPEQARTCSGPVPCRRPLTWSDVKVNRPFFLENAVRKGSNADTLQDKGLCRVRRSAMDGVPNYRWDGIGLFGQTNRG